MTSLGEARTVPGGLAAIPRGYLVWLAGALASLVGDAALYFALGWAASAHGGQAAALVLTAITVPRTLLFLLGGAVGDRFGARRVMIVGDLVMLAATVTLAISAFGLGTPVWLLILAAAVIGTVDAFYLPASGSMPRRLVSGDLLPRALALRQAGGQIAVLAGAPLGAVIVAGAGLDGVALVDAGTFAAVLVVLVCVRPIADVERSARGESLLSGAVGGVRLALDDPVMRRVLLLTAVAAGFLLPVVSLLNPLLAREQQWGSWAAGLVAAGQSCGVIAVALLISRQGTMRRIGVGAVLGLCFAAAGITIIALAPDAAVAMVGGIVLGTGSGMFAGHFGPLVLTGVPDTHLSRMQAMIGLVQSLALVLANNALGGLADTVGATTTTLICAITVGTAGISGLASKPIRHLHHST